MQTVSIVVLASAMVALPARGVLRLRRGRRDLAPWSRLVLACLAAAVTLAALLGLDRWADRMLSAHMLQHMLIGDLVPLILVLAVRGPLVVQLVPAAGVRVARRLRVHRALTLATRPTVAFLAWVTVFGAWHIPAAYDAALGNEQLHAFEHATFMLVGLLVWTVLLDPARRGTLPGWRRFGYALALLAASGALANTLILSYRSLYPSYAGPASRPFGLSPVGDQDLAALLMMLEQFATLGTFAFLAARRQLAAAAALEGPKRHPLAA